MNGQLFRKKSLDRVSSPEQLNDYIRVSNPGIWLILSAIVILLIGVCVWGVMGHLDTTIDTVAISYDGVMNVYIKEEDYDLVKAGMNVSINDKDYTLSAISGEPIALDSEFSEYALRIGALQMGEWVYTAEVNGIFDDGVYSAKIVTESVSPISFVIN